MYYKFYSIINQNKQCDISIKCAYVLIISSHFDYLLEFCLTHRISLNFKLCGMQRKQNIFMQYNRSNEILCKLEYIIILVYT